MSEVLVFAGTTEGRRLSEYLAKKRVSHTVCVATQYGEGVLGENPFVTVHRGRMSREEIRDFIADGNFLAVVDATHPYAEEVTRNIKAAMEGMTIPYLRLKRDGLSKTYGEEGEVSCFDSNEACASALTGTEGNILLTTGSRALSAYCVSEELKDRLYVRVLPDVESLSACVAQGIGGKQIIAMQGPFTVQMNEAVLCQYGISVLVTKESGYSGGFTEKLEAAKRAGVKVFVIRRPKGEEGYSFAEICEKLGKLCGREICGEENGSFIHITLAGAGMGGEDGLTKEVCTAIQEADVLLGAERLIAPYRPGAEKQPYYLAEQIVPRLKKLQEIHSHKGRDGLCRADWQVVVLFSGDSGFYSGCRKLYCVLDREIREGRIQGTLRVLPGISSVAALAARMGESYQDAAVYSMHGKNLTNIVQRIKKNTKTFLLTSGVQDVNRLGMLLEQAGMEECRVTAGYQLSQEGEQVLILSPQECQKRREEGLYTCMVSNPKAVADRLTHGMADSAFLREQIPMTKEEVREISICKLHLCSGAVVYDIGGGTGSVAVEMAGLSDEIRVYALERKKEAVDLIRRNCEKFDLENIAVVETEAPEGMDGLPAATHAFIGGSGGRLKEILEKLYQINFGMRVVLNAVSLETVSAVRELFSDERTENVEIVQVQISRAKKAGNHHLMRAENPVWICAFTFKGSAVEEDDGRE
ncbi:MAG: precorrin-6A reductase [Lachnospiraceae bacterium]|nr:precorrin-6A reductase [Lachnospiraceae bacterium]